MPAGSGGGQRSLLVGMEQPPSPPALVLAFTHADQHPVLGDLSFIKTCPGDVTRIPGEGVSRSLHWGRRRPASSSVLCLGGTGGRALPWERWPLSASRHHRWVHSSPVCAPYLGYKHASNFRVPSQVRWFYVMGHGRILGNQSRAWGPRVAQRTTVS